MQSNPFFELYVGEKMSAKDFVTTFSPFLVQHTLPLFYPGNVVVTGMQGSGKSMLLTLLKPETRQQYEAAGGEFPVPAQLRKFVSANVNIAHSNAVDFGYRDWRQNDPVEVELLFGDFLNCLILQNLFKTLEVVGRGSKGIQNEVGVHFSPEKMLEFSRLFSNDPIWDGAFSSVKNYVELRQSIDDRVGAYRRYLHRRVDEIPDTILKTRTSIGDPVGLCADMLKGTGLLDADTNVFVDIDQYEELANISAGPNHAKIDYRSVINRAIARRDARISFRVGSRGHAWRRHARILGTSARLEEERDYKFVDLDRLLKRSESGRDYIFPLFAQDVFNRRMMLGANYDGKPKTSPELMRRVYGADLNAEEKAKLSASREPAKMLDLDPDWHASTKARLIGLAEKGQVLSAKLGEIWVRQKGDNVSLSVRDGDLPWEKAKWWKKERAELALLQMISKNQQRPIWCGPNEIIELSNGNILVFISINQFIWDTWYRYASKALETTSGLPTIGIDLQSIGILKASEYWYQKVSLETGRSDERARFIRETSRFLRERLMSDRKLSNPGETGFSIKAEDLDQMPNTKDFLEEMSDYGNLMDVEHTTKEKNRAPRRKWYFNPIFCPYLKIPHQRTKEPFYANLQHIGGWLAAAGIKLGDRVIDTSPPQQESLF